MKCIYCIFTFIQMNLHHFLGLTFLYNYSCLTEIEVANWLTLPDDIEKPGEGYDCAICIGNSFAHLPDFEGNLANQKLAMKNFYDMLKPGGILIIDHRNYDAILDTGRAPVKNIYYKVRPKIMHHQKSATQLKCVLNSANIGFPFMDPKLCMLIIFAMCSQYGLEF